MAKRISDKTRFKEKRGIGIHDEYHPWIKTREFTHGTGTRACFPDPITGRPVHLLSLNEMNMYFLLRFSDDVTDIREQFPLPVNEIRKIANELGLPSNRYKNVLTTDLLVTINNDYDKGLIAISIKQSKKNLKQSEKERIFVEKSYWNSKGIPFYLIDSEEINVVKANHLRHLYLFYNIDNVNSEHELLKHLIITKQITIDLNTKSIDYKLAKLMYKRMKK